MSEQAEKVFLSFFQRKKKKPEEHRREEERHWRVYVVCVYKTFSIIPSEQSRRMIWIS